MAATATIAAVITTTIIKVEAARATEAWVSPLSTVDLARAREPAMPAESVAGLPEGEAATRVVAEVVTANQ